MKSEFLTENHCSRDMEINVRSICEPLKRFGITYFSYVRFFNDGSLYFMGTHWDSSYHHYKNQFTIGPPCPKELISNNFHYIPYVTYADDTNFKNIQVVSDYRNLFDLSCPIYFIENSTNYTDLFIYGPSYSECNEFKVINFYLNNINIFEKFKFYFKDKARKMIKKCNGDRIIWPKYALSNFVLPNKDYINKQNSIEWISPSRFFLSGAYEDISITNKELAVVKHLASGCTIKEAAKFIKISPRTVESYLNNLKFKLQLEKKSQIIQIMSEFNLL